jgi:hypothetical protein
MSPPAPKRGCGVSLAAASLLALSALLAFVSQTLPFSAASLRSGKGFLSLRTELDASPAALCVTVVSEAVEADPSVGAQLPPDVLARLPPGAAASLARGGPVESSCAPWTPAAVRAAAAVADGGGGGGGGLNQGQAELVWAALFLLRASIWTGAALALVGAVVLALPAPPSAAAGCGGCGCARAACSGAVVAWALLLCPLLAWAGLREQERAHRAVECPSHEQELAR